jgi:hypothetical protein
MPGPPHLPSEAPYWQASLRMGSPALLKGEWPDSLFQRQSSSLPWHPIPPFHSSVLVRACMRPEIGCLNRQHTGLRLTVVQRTRQASRLGWRCPVAVGWIWRLTLCAHASLSGAAGRLGGQALCNHYSTTTRQSETQRSGIPSSC